MSPPLFAELSSHTNLFHSLAAFAQSLTALSLDRDGTTVKLIGTTTTPGFFEILGVRPSAGRTFMPDEGGPGKDGVLVASYGFWQRHFGGDPNPGGLIVAEITFAVVILAAAGLMIRSIVHVLLLDLGFYPRNLLKALVITPSGDNQASTAFINRLGDNLAGLPGVQLIGIIVNHYPPPSASIPHLHSVEGFVEG